jgi:oligopeptidase B
VHEEVLLNANEIMKDHRYLAVNIVKLSSDHQFVAYTLDTTGEETYTLYIKDIEKNKILVCSMIMCFVIAGSLNP